MWNSGFMKVIRWLIYIPLTILVIGLIEWIFGWIIRTVLGWGLSLFWLVMFVLFFGAMIWGIFQIIANFIAFLTIQVCPDKKSGGYIFASLVGLEFLFLLYSVWQMPPSYTFYSVIFCIFMSFLVLQLGGILITIAVEEANGRI